MATILSGQLDLSSAREGVALASNTDVASFTDNNLADTASAFTTTIDWGDGTTTAGTVVGSNGSFTVEGGHTYADEDQFPALVTVTRTADSSQLLMAGTVPVADTDVFSNLHGNTITFTPNTPLTNVTVATFTDSNTVNVAVDFTAQIDWGDGTTTTGTVQGSNGSFSIVGSHTYTAAGEFTVSVAFADDAPDAASGFVTGAAVSGFGGQVTLTSATEGTALNGAEVATFADTSGSHVAGDYTANIDWGDGTTTPGTVSGSGQSFSVTGTHIYADEESNEVDGTSPLMKVSITRTADSTTVTPMGTVVVADADFLTTTSQTVGGSPSTPLASVVVAKFNDSYTGNIAGDFTTTIDWGDGSTVDTGTVSGSSGSFTVTGSHTYTANGQYNINVGVLEDIPQQTQIGAIASKAIIGLAPGNLLLTNITEGDATSHNVATFSDGNASDTAAAFTASIDWGDGTTTAGTITGASGSFTVAGGHAYADEGDEAPIVTVTRTADGETAAITGTTTVAEADALAITANNISGNPGQPFNNVPMASFTTTFLGNVAGDFSATIDWGDGTTTAGTVSGSNGSFIVTGSHTYTAGGQDTLKVTVADDAPGTASAIGSATATINFAGQMALTSATEAVALANNTPVATFSDSNGGDTPASFTATIDWGDGVTSAGTVSGGAGTFTVSGGHTYADEGNDQASVTLTHTADQAKSTISGSVAVAEHDSLAAQPVMFSALAGHAFSGTVATFTDTDTANVAGDFIAVIDWGDGVTTAGTVSGSNGSFNVSGTHTYATAGQDTIQVHVADDAPGTATADATSTALITHPRWMATVDLGVHPAGWQLATTGDFNGDGISDVLWYNPTSGNVDLWKIFNGQWAGSVNVGTHPAGWQPAGSGDFNHDGISDVLWYNSTSGDIDIWKISNSGQWSGSVDAGSHPAGWQPAGVGDFNGDGTSDVLWYNPTTNDAELWKISNGQWAGSVDLGSHPAGWQPAGVGDFNGDGTSDVLWYNPTTGDADLWKISNGQWAGSVDLGSHPAGWAPAGVGDFDADGTSDVLWFNAATGDAEVWLISNGHWAGSVDLGTHPTGWTPVAVGDFNHDGTSDILWRQTSTGHTEDWLLASH